MLYKGRDSTRMVSESNNYRGNLLYRSDISPQKFELISPFDLSITFLMDILGYETLDSAVRSKGFMKKKNWLVIVP